jgi:hypothetical protein
MKRENEFFDVEPIRLGIYTISRDGVLPWLELRAKNGAKTLALDE